MKNGMISTEIRLLKNWILITVLLCVFSYPFFGCLNAKAAIADLKCEYIDNPIGIDAQIPRFTWIVTGSDAVYLQDSYQICIATSPQLLLSGAPDVWSSGKVMSASNRVVYNGSVDLKSHQKYYWNVIAKDRQGKEYCSDCASFEMGKMNLSDWKAQWISDSNDKEFRSSPLFRKNFEVGKKIATARAYVSGLGYYELYLNGNRVGKNILDPGYTHFDKRVLYVTHDITSLLKDGDNCAAAVLGNGWFNVQSRGVWDFEKARWRNRPQLLCEIRITYKDGTVETIASDESWKTSTGAYQFNNIYSGDIYDARLEKKGWKMADFDDSQWVHARCVSAPAPIVQAQVMPAIHVTSELKPVSMNKISDKIYVYDLGANISGLCRLQLKGEAGTRVALRHGELLTKEGRLEQGNLNIYFKPIDPTETFQEDIYILNGEGEETYTPSFSYHGFQYVEVISSAPINLNINSLTGLHFYNDVKPVGHFSCSNETLNKIWRATCLSYVNNMESIPTDCPQREKNGWTADAHVSVDLGLLNYDGLSFYEKWMNDFIDNQRPEGDISGIIPSSGWGYGEWIGPVWDAAMFVIPHALYMYYGESRAIEAIYPTCEKYLTYLKTKEKEGLLAYGLGDWLPYKSQTPIDFTSSCYYYLDYVRMAGFAKLLGKDPSSYQQKAEEIRKLINKKYFHPETNTYANGTQTALGVALYMGLVPSEKEQAVADQLAAAVRATDCYLDFGVLGSKTVPAMLTKYGYVDLAFAMASKEKAPSWGYWVNECKMTTLGETWIMSPKFNDASLDHVFMGDIIAWMQNTLAGINYDSEKPGFRHVIIRPHFVKGLDWVNGSFESPQGLISSEWKRKGQNVVLDVTIPIGCRATIYLEKQYEVDGGKHQFVVKP